MKRVNFPVKCYSSPCEWSVCGDVMFAPLLYTHTQTKKYISVMDILISIFGVEDFFKEEKEKEENVRARREVND